MNPIRPSSKNSLLQVFFIHNPSKTMSLREFTIKVVSKASMETFAEKLPANFTTLLPEQLNLTRFWEVALAEIAWPAAIQNVTTGHFKYRVGPEEQDDKDTSGSCCTDTRKKTLNERPYGKVTLCELPLRPVQKPIIEKLGNIKPGVYLGVDQVLRSMRMKNFGGGRGGGTWTKSYLSRGN